ncbi:hypothetical protein CSW98_04560 [Vibrio sp. HA2012]|uniref:class I SAM-dependent methyltransferase n=1 Tax=Vibrio sp. HA2012 TaxID=1971595 RepID=UPI000C2CD6DF|nr:SAM-dependent methyltransferase [Vibrio sp. HA2012]PJC87179.1 hypothetical protein CSW98_04560 [Vibrio sp. HA2012]
MLIGHETKIQLAEFSTHFGLLLPQQKQFQDKSKKLEQILAYLETIHSQLRHYSTKRELVIIDSGAGNCYLSFIVYYFYQIIMKRPVQLHCIDINERLMDKNREFAQQLGFSDMFFHACDIATYQHQGKVDLAYSLHACDTATDKAILLGAQNQARHILSASCCQHSIKKSMQTMKTTKGITRHTIYRDRMLYMLADSMRALLLEMLGYQVDVIEFVSSRATDKNTLLRAHKRQCRDPEELRQQYQDLRNAFRVVPALETYLKKADLLTLCGISATK